MTGQDIQNWARLFSNNPDFQATEGWLSKFLERNKIVQRRQTHIGQKLKENYLNDVSKFLEVINYY